MISAVKNHTTTSIVTIASLAVIGVALAAIAFPHLSAHLPKALQDGRVIPYLAVSYGVIGLGGIAWLALGQAKKHEMSEAPTMKETGKTVGKLMLTTLIVVATVVALSVLHAHFGAWSPALQHAGKYLAAHKQALVIGGTVVLAAIGIVYILRRKKT